MDDLRPHQRSALRVLAANGRLPASVLARAVGHAPGEAAEFGRRLAARGLVALEGGSNRRPALVSLTERGRRVLARVGGVVAIVVPLGLASGTADAHDWYGGLTIPSGPMKGVSCCSGQDCRPTDYCRLPDGKQGIVSRFGCVPIPWSQVLGVPSPDGRPHLCEAPSTAAFTPYCVVLEGSAGLLPGGFSG
jgi:DNA-binding MarR family transcriptional regulator